MFWKKRTYQDPKLGAFTYSHGLWSGIVEGPEGSVIAVCLDGDRNQPDPHQLEVAQRLVASAGELRQRALEYLRGREDVREFAEGHGELLFDGIHPGREEGSFDLSFGFTQWPDGYVTVHFTRDQPTDVTMGD
jgi:hypothetical protein